MKKLTLTLVSLILAIGSQWASPVEQATAHRLAVNFWNTYRPLQTAPVDALKCLHFDELQHMYVFVNNGEGFVIVSSDDCVRPVLGYSFDDPFPEQLHPELRYWLSTYEQQIRAITGQRGATPLAADPRWATLLDGEVPLRLDKLLLLLLAILALAGLVAMCVRQAVVV